MKIRKAIKLAVAGAAIALPVGITLAANMMPGTHTGPLTIHGNWSINSGDPTNLSVNCPTGFTCGTAAVTDVGFMQRTITDSSGNQYIQTIIGEGSDGDKFGSQTGSTFFGDENFIMLNGAGGISAQNEMRDATTGTAVFTGKTNLNTGMEFATMQASAAGGSMGDGSMVELQQGIVDTANEFQSQFQFDHGMISTAEGGGKFAVIGISDFANDSAGNFASSFEFQNKDYENNSTLNPEQKMDLVMKLDPADITQDFSVKTRSGGAVAAGSAVFNGGAPVVTFAAGDSIYQMDLGQSVTGAGEFGITDFQVKGGGSGKMQSLTSSSIPFNTVTDANNPTDPGPFKDFDPFAP